MISKTNTQFTSGTVYVRIPPHMVEYLQLKKEESTELLIMDDTGKHGNFISIWRQDQK